MSSRLIRRLKIRLHERAYGFLRQGYAVYRKTGLPLPGMARLVRHRLLGTILPVRSINEPMERAVAVVIPCHNYGQYLAGTIESLLNQTIPPVDIVVVDDASTDNTAQVAALYAEKGVRYLRGEWQDVSLARNAGASTTDETMIIFCDADDTLPPAYIERCLEAMQDPRVAIAYGDMNHIGEKNIMVTMSEFDSALLEKENFISSHALIRRQAYDLAGGYRNSHSICEDWDLYRRIVRMGWRAQKTDTFVNYRVHATSRYRSMVIAGNRRFWKEACIKESPVTISTVFTGKKENLTPFLDSLSRLTFPSDLVRFHAFDKSGDASFNFSLRTGLNSYSASEILVSSVSLPDLHTHALAQRFTALYEHEITRIFAHSHLLNTCNTEFILFLADDVLLPPDAIQHMIDGIRGDEAASVIHCPSASGRDGVWISDADGRPVYATERGRGIGDIGGSGFRACLIRTSMLKEIPLHTRIHKDPALTFEETAFIHLRTRGRIVCNWDIEAEVMKI